VSAVPWLSLIIFTPWAGAALLALCAAPGGKLTYIAQLMRNEGRLLAHDTAPDRLNKLGVEDELLSMGAERGDTVAIGGITYTFVPNSAALAAPDVFAGPSDLPQFRLQPPGRLGRIADYFNASDKVAQWHSGKEENKSNTLPLGHSATLPLKGHGRF